MDIALIVPVYKRFDLFTRLMATVDEPVRVIVVDNYNNNRGVAGGWNEGIRAAQEVGYRYAIISNDDIEFHKGAISSIYNSFRKSDAGVISANPNGVFAAQGLIPGADFCCFAVDIPVVVDRCGTFDENFFPAYFEDNDFHHRIRRAGVPDYIDTEAVVTHHGSQTQNADPGSPVVPSHKFEENRSYFIRKWGGTPNQETYEHPYNNPELTIKDWVRQ